MEVKILIAVVKITAMQVPITINCDIIIPANKCTTLLVIVAVTNGDCMACTLGESCRIV